MCVVTTLFDSVASYHVSDPCLHVYRNIYIYSKLQTYSHPTHIIMMMPI